MTRERFVDAVTLAIVGCGVVIVWSCVQWNDPKFHPVEPDYTREPSPHWVGAPRDAGRD